MSYCNVCGSKLTKKECINFGISDGLVPFCPTCNEFKFPMFNVAVSSIIFNPDHTKILLIQQYGKKNNILVAGYVTKTENLEIALKREIMEEVGLKVKDFTYNASEYFERSNSLICNFMVTVEDDNFNHSKEVDYANWYSIEEAKAAILKDSLAERFLLKAIDKLPAII